MLGVALVAAVAQAAERAPSTAEGFEVIRRENVLVIEAANRRDLSRALFDLRRARGWHGQTALVFEQQAELVPRGAGCRLEAVRTTLVVTVTLPRLHRHGAALDDPVFERLWQAAVNGLRVHEEGHVAIGIEGARIAHARLLAAGPFADCRAARRMLMREEFRFRHHQAVQHERYDRRTGSGARQGAVLAPP
jgi:predicted secreted Zn-dependent protease